MYPRYIHCSFPERIFSAAKVSFAGSGEDTFEKFKTTRDGAEEGEQGSWRGSTFDAARNII